MMIERPFFGQKDLSPRFKTQIGLETPNPIDIAVTRGEADIEVVCKDILGLTKLNYNACIYGDGVPVTLKFADSIGEILTAGKEIKTGVFAVQTLYIILSVFIHPIAFYYKIRVNRLISIAKYLLSYFGECKSRSGFQNIFCVILLFYNDVSVVAVSFLKGKQTIHVNCSLI